MSYNYNYQASSKVAVSGKMDLRRRQKHFMCLLERINEPLFVSTKGTGSSEVLFNIPPNELDEASAEAMIELREKIPHTSRIEVVTIREPKKKYDLKKANRVPRHGHFSMFIPEHAEAAMSLQEILSKDADLEEFLSLSALCRDKVNPLLFLQAFMSAAIRRKDMNGFIPPNLWEIVPDLFIDEAFLRVAKEQASLPRRFRAVVEIPVNHTGLDTEPENKVAYFREDIGINSFHTHWHWMLPFAVRNHNIDRKGELFAFMHHEILARYNTERLCNGLARVRPFNLQNGLVCEEGYFPKITLQLGGRKWGTRQPGTPLQNLNRSNDPTLRRRLELDDIRLYLERAIEAVDAGFAISVDGRKVNLLNNQGIDVLGNMVEASFDSPNPRYYGSPHNFGHLFLSCQNDPNYNYKENPGVMGHPAVAMRDPVFYRWHKLVDEIFIRHKRTLTPYSETELGFSGINVSNIEVQTQSLEPNNLVTFWMKSDVDLSRGIDFIRLDSNKLGPVFCRVTHLQHKEFNYTFTVLNSLGRTVEGTVRVYMAPKLDETNTVFQFAEQRGLFFQLDTFRVRIVPGENQFRRSSAESSVAISWGQSFRELERDEANPPRETIFCGCGWPDHFLIPKGTHKGFLMDFFVMITDSNLDRVPGSEIIQGSGNCKLAFNYCGYIDQKYPDAMPGGFPFDRQPQPASDGSMPEFLSDFMEPFPNMASTQVKILHRDVTVLREGSSEDAKIIQAD